MDAETPTLANIERLLTPVLEREMRGIREPMVEYYGEEPHCRLDKVLAETRHGIIEDILRSVMVARRMGMSQSTLAIEVDLAWRARIAFLEKQEIGLHDLILNSRGGLRLLRRLLNPVNSREEETPNG